MDIDQEYDREERIRSAISLLWQAMGEIENAPTSDSYGDASKRDISHHIRLALDSVDAFADLEDDSADYDNSALEAA